MIKRSLLSLASLAFVSLAGVALGCSGSSATQPPTRYPEPADAPLQLPEYPGAIEAGVSGGPEPVATKIALDPVDAVRAFYSRERLTGFDVLDGDLTTANPLHVRDASGRRDYFISVYAENGVTMLETRHSDFTPDEASP